MVGRKGIKLRRPLKVTNNNIVLSRGYAHTPHLVMCMEFFIIKKIGKLSHSIAVLGYKDITCKNEIHV